MLEPRLTTEPAATYVGCGQSFIHALSPDSNAAKVLGALWCKFLPLADTIPHRIGNEMFGVIYGLPVGERSHPDELQYVAGVRVSEVDTLPEGMVSWTVPAAEFAVFAHRGPIDRIAQTCHQIYRDWLPASPFEHAQIADVEVYGPRFDGETEDSEMDYWISIRPTAD